MIYVVVIDWSEKKKQTRYLIPAESKEAAALEVGIRWTREFEGNYKLVSIEEAPPPQAKNLPPEDSHP